MSYIHIPVKCTEFAENVTASKQCYPMPEPVYIPVEIDNDFYQIVKETIQDFDWDNPVDETFVETLSLSLQDLFITPKGLKIFPTNISNKSLKARNEDVSIMIAGSANNFIFEAFEVIGNTIAWHVVDSLEEFARQCYGVDSLFSYEESVMFGPEDQDEQKGATLETKKNRIKSTKREFLERVADTYRNGVQASGQESEPTQEVALKFVEKMIRYSFDNPDREEMQAFIAKEVVDPVLAKGVEQDPDLSLVHIWLIAEKVQEHANLLMRSLELVGFADYGVGVFYDGKIAFGK